ncbi:MAG: hypothetical protein IMZ74_17150, partial [Actinobacteria bacterium]|nr:hypothetical protein [Actinomycetota bacterium]
NHVLEDVFRALASLQPLAPAILVRAACLALRFAVAVLRLATTPGVLTASTFHTVVALGALQRLTFALTAAVLAETAARATSLALVFCWRLFGRRSTFCSNYHRLTSRLFRLARPWRAGLARLRRLAGVCTTRICGFALRATILLLAARSHEVAQASAQTLAARGGLSPITAVLSRRLSVGVGRHTCIHGIWLGAHNVFQI